MAGQWRAGAQARMSPSRQAPITTSRSVLGERETTSGTRRSTDAGTRPEIPTASAPPADSTAQDQARTRQASTRAEPSTPEESTGGTPTEISSRSAPTWPWGSCHHSSG
ncbi:hypothetical protein ACSL103130_08725 [Actinomyces slackii]